MFVWYAAAAGAQDFSIQWLDSMAGYLGKSVLDIPDTYNQAEEDQSVYNKSSAGTVTETFSLDSRAYIQGAAWIKTSPKPKIEYKRIMAVLETALGEPMFLDRDRWLALWNWRAAYPLTLYIMDDESILVGVLTLEALNMTREEWEQIIQLCQIMMRPLRGF